MHKKVLSETVFYYGELPHISHVSNEEIKNFILKEFSKIKSINEDRYKDIKLPAHKHISWIIDYVRDIVKTKFGFTLIPINIISQVHEIKETTIKRNHVNPYDIHNSPDFTLIYCVDFNEEDQLVIEFEDHRNKENYWTIPIKNKDFVMWNSDLNYYISPNKKEKFRIYLLIHFQKI